MKKFKKYINNNLPHVHESSLSKKHATRLENRSSSSSLWQNKNNNRHQAANIHKC